MRIEQDSNKELVMRSISTKTLTLVSDCTLALLVGLLLIAALPFLAAVAFVARPLLMIGAVVAVIGLLCLSGGSRHRDRAQNGSGTHGRQG